MRGDRLTDAELALRPQRVTGPVMAAFIAAAAIRPAAAMTYRPGTPAAAAEFRRLHDEGVLRGASDGHWYDLRRHYAVQQARAARRAVIGVVLALTIAAAAVLFYRS